MSSHDPRGRPGAPGPRPSWEVPLLAGGVVAILGAGLFWFLRPAPEAAPPPAARAPAVAPISQATPDAGPPAEPVRTRPISPGPAPASAVATAPPAPREAPPAPRGALVPAEPPPDEPVQGDYDQLMQASIQQVAMGRRAEAVERLLEAARLEPAKPGPHQRLCAILQPLGRLDEARRHCERWRDLEPNPSYRARAEGIVEQLEAEIEGGSEADAEVEP